MNEIIFDLFRMRNRTRRHARVWECKYLCALTVNGLFGLSNSGISEYEFCDLTFGSAFDYVQAINKIKKSLWMHFSGEEEMSYTNPYRIVANQKVLICDKCGAVHAADPFSEYAGDPRFKCSPMESEFVDFFKCNMCAREIQMCRERNSRRAIRSMCVTRADRGFFSLIAGASAIAGSELVKK